MAWHKFEYSQPGGWKKLIFIFALAVGLLAIAFYMR
jgi:hypothetical protein